MASKITSLIERGINPAARKDQARYAQDLSNLRNLFLGKNAGLKSDDLRKNAKTIRDYAADPSGLLDALVGVSYHDDGDVVLEAAYASVRQKCLQTGVDLKTLRFEDVRQWFDAFDQSLPEDTRVSNLEGLALCHYEASVKLGFQDKYFSETSIMASANDLLYRSALRLADARARNHLLNELQRKLLSLAEREPSSGVRAEYLLVWLMRNLVREQGIDHLVSVEHASVRADLTGGPDIMMRSIPWGSIGIQLKTLIRTEYTAVHHEGVIRQARKELKGSGTYLAEIDSVDFGKLIHKEKEKKRDARLRNKILGALKDEAPSEAGELFDTLRKPPQVDVLQTTQLEPEKPKAVRFLPPSR